ncbi:exodeoxyribonuclease VII large subunit [Myroides sp. LJL115]
MEEKQPKWFSLDVILNRVKEIFDSSISGKTFWLKVEVAQLKKDRRGHYYLELVENKQGVTLAKARATIWRQSALAIEDNLGEKKDSILKEGAQILCLGEVIFSPIYGLSINILDIDLSFSLGEVERKKQQAILTLQQQGLIDLNKQVPLPVVIQKIAVLASVNSAGYMDFINQLETNEYSFYFSISSYDTKVQGDRAHLEILEKLHSIKKDHYDVVVLLRGGGAAMDLDVFNNLALSKCIATFHTPVFTAIGHQTDTSVVDFVANHSFKTPSAAGAFIVERNFKYWIKMKDLFFQIKQYYGSIKEQQNFLISQRALTLSNLGKSTTIKKMSQINSLQSQLSLMVREPFFKQTISLESIAQQVGSIAKAACTEQLQYLIQKSSNIALFTSSTRKSAEYQLTNQQELLGFYAKSILKKNQIQQDQINQMLQAYDLESVLKKGFSIVRLNNKILTKDTVLKIGDVLEIQILDKAYLITIKDFKETILWKNLLMKKPQEN